jgi:hypothetical protein
MNKCDQISVEDTNPVVGLRVCDRCEASGYPAALLPVGRQAKTGRKVPCEKIEQDASESCLKSEYLTLLNSFRVLQHCDYKALGPAVGSLSSWLPPKLFNEKELYGR